MKKIKSFIGLCIWEVKEFLGISLGKYAPIVFGWIVEAEPIKVEEDKQWHK